MHFSRIAPALALAWRPFHSGLRLIVMAVVISMVLLYFFNPRNRG
jgi:hypothetical protein